MHSSLRVPWVLLFLFVALISPVLNAPRATAADENAELDRRTNYWRTQLPFCNWPGFAPYPSKFDDVLPDPADPLKGQCNDGDSVIFNGVLCASGDDRGCDAVRRSQAPDGEFWRSPRKVGVSQRMKHHSAMTTSSVCGRTLHTRRTSSPSENGLTGSMGSRGHVCAKMINAHLA